MLSRGFGDLPDGLAAHEGAAIAILPIPFDVSSTWLKGSEKGPSALIDASAHLELYDIETKTEVYKRGIYTCKPVLEQKTSEMVNTSKEQVARLLDDGKFVVTLGGEHTVSFGPIAAHLEKHPRLSVLQLDAHSDRRDEFEDDRYNHACIMARVAELTSEIVSVGIRSMDASEMEGLDESRMFYAHMMQGGDGWMDEAVGKLTDDVYITIDLDVFDPSIMPSTGTPEPGGMWWYQVLKFLKLVIRSRNVLGFDVVELCPGENRAPDFLAAKLIYTLLSYKFSV